MDEQLYIEIKGHVADYVGRRISLPKFKEWFVPVSIAIDSIGSRRTIRIVDEIDGILAEASSADWSDEEIRDEMSALCPYYREVIVLGDGETPSSIHPSVMAAA